MQKQTPKKSFLLIGVLGALVASALFVISNASPAIDPVVDVGDAPDSRNHFAVPMTFTAATPQPAMYPTVWDYDETLDPGLNGYGLCHYDGPSYLGTTKTLELDADYAPDEDGLTNLIPTNDTSDMDEMSETLNGDNSLTLPNLMGTCAANQITIEGYADPMHEGMFLNVWIDWNQDGDWNDALIDDCPTEEWAVTNYPVAPGQFTEHPMVIAPQFPSDLDPNYWIRVTLTDIPLDDADDLFYPVGGQDSGCFEDGETEDFYYPIEFVNPEADQDSDEVVDYLDNCPFNSNPNQEDSELVELYFDNHVCDSIEDGVCLGRSCKDEVFNVDDASIEWADGSCDTPGSFYSSLKSLYGGDMSSMESRNTCLHVISSDNFYDIDWDSWTSGGNGGGFAYFRDPEGFYFEKGDYESLSDCIEEGVCIARNCDGEPYNDAEGPSISWAMGSCGDNPQDLNFYSSLKDATNWDMNSLPGRSTCLRVNDEVYRYYTLDWDEWEDNKRGGFAYTKYEEGGDGVGDACDNCPLEHNYDQSDLDEDGIGDDCDNCSMDYNPGQEDVGEASEMPNCNGGCTAVNVGGDTYFMDTVPREPSDDCNGYGDDDDDDEGCDVYESFNTCTAAGGRVPNYDESLAWNAQVGMQIDSSFDIIYSPDGSELWYHDYPGCTCNYYIDPNDSGDGEGLACVFDSLPDGVGDACDNCSHTYNPDQEPDSECDGHPDTDDNCPNSINADQNDADGDNFGDTCDLCVYSPHWQVNHVYDYSDDIAGEHSDFAYHSAQDYSPPIGEGYNLADEEEFYTGDNCSEDQQPHTFHIYVKENGEWTEKAQYNYPVHYEDYSFDLNEYLPDSDGEYKVKIVHVGDETAQMDALTLGGNGPILAQIEEGEDITQKVTGHDNDIAEVGSKSVIASFASTEDSTLNLRAREETALSLEINKPFLFPGVRDEYFEYSIDANNQIVVDGVLDDNLGNHKIKINTFPTSGHPAGYIYGYVTNDENNLYISLDITPDNTDDRNLNKGDFAEVLVKTKSGNQSFKVTETDTLYGQLGFGYTDKVDYEHKVAEIKIPLSEIGKTVGKTVKFKLSIYGTYGGSDEYYCQIAESDSPDHYPPWYGKEATTDDSYEAYYNTQRFEIFIDDPVESNEKLRVLWEGQVRNQNQNDTVYLYIWNNNLNEWELIDTDPGYMDVELSKILDNEDDYITNNRIVLVAQANKTEILYTDYVKAEIIESIPEHDTDGDSDGVGDYCDNCIANYNPGQEDTDFETTVFENTTISEQAEDCINDDVCITRDYSGGLYNAQGTPIEWACGDCNEPSTQWYSSEHSSADNIWRDLKYNCFGGNMTGAPGSQVCLHTVNSDQHYQIDLTKWAQGGGGAFAYERTDYPAGTPTVEFENPGTINHEKDCLETGVCLTRGMRRAIYNAQGTPYSLACGECGAETTSYYSTSTMSNNNVWQNMKNNCFGGSMNNIEGNNICLHAETSDTYYDMNFTDYESGNETSEYAYDRNAGQSGPSPTQGTGGPLSIHFEKNDPEGSGLEDCIEPEVCLQRGWEGPVYNNGEATIEWSLGECKPNSDFFSSLRNLFGEGGLKNIASQTTCLLVENTNHRYNIHWTGWQSNKGGAFSYEREGLRDGIGDACDEDTPPRPNNDRPNRGDDDDDDTGGGSEGPIGATEPQVDTPEVVEHCLEFQDRTIAYEDDFSGIEWMKPYVDFLSQLRIMQDENPLFVLNGKDFNGDPSSTSLIIDAMSNTKRYEAIIVALKSYCIAPYTDSEREGQDGNPTLNADFADFPRIVTPDHPGMSDPLMTLDRLNDIANYIYKAKDLGIIKGQLGTDGLRYAAFNDDITRAELMVIFLNTSGMTETGNNVITPEEIALYTGYYNDVPATHWASSYVPFAAKHGIVAVDELDPSVDPGDRFAYPNRPAVRGEVFAMDVRMLYITTALQYTHPYSGFEVWNSTLRDLIISTFEGTTNSEFLLQIVGYLDPELAAELFGNLI